MFVPKLIDVTPFEPLIIKVHYDGFDWNKLKPICEKMLADAPAKVDLEQHGASSSVSNRDDQPHIMKEFSEFYKWLTPITHHILFKEWGFIDEYEYFISNSWVNLHPKGGITTEHHHGPCALVCATYLNMPENGGYIQFRDPTDIYKSFHSRMNEDNFTWRKVLAKTGDTLIFPAWLRHKTEPNGSNEDRWVMTTNLMNSFRPPADKLESFAKKHNMKWQKQS